MAGGAADLMAAVLGNTVADPGDPELDWTEDIDALTASVQSIRISGGDAGAAQIARAVKSAASATLASAGAFPPAPEPDLYDPFSASPPAKQAGFSLKKSAQASLRNSHTRQQKQNIARQADTSAKAWTDFKAAAPAATKPVFGNKVAFTMGAPKSKGDGGAVKKQTHTAEPVSSPAARPPARPAAASGAAAAKPERGWADFKQPAAAQPGWDAPAAAAPAPAAPAAAAPAAVGVGPCLRVVRSADPALRPGAELRVPTAALTAGAGYVSLGRSTRSRGGGGSFLTVRDSEASSTHAQLGVSADGSLWLTDAGSNNGTYVNSRRLSASREWSQPVRLHTGDVVHIGQTELTAWSPPLVSDDRPWPATPTARTRPANLEPEPEPENLPVQPGSPPPPPPQPSLAVLDTNILLDERELTSLRQLMARGIGANGRPGALSLSLVLPIVVLQVRLAVSCSFVVAMFDTYFRRFAWTQELDGLKKNHDVDLARRAVTLQALCRRLCLTVLLLTEGWLLQRRGVGASIFRRKIGLK